MYLCHPGFIPGATLAAYVKPANVIGTSIAWEQQQWLQAMGVVDKVAWRKEQNRIARWRIWRGNLVSARRCCKKNFMPRMP